MARAALTGLGLAPPTARPEPAALLVERLVTRATGLATAGDLADVASLLDGVLWAGSGAEHRRAAYGRRRRLTDVVDRPAEAVLAC
ncbi:hypothetical protein [Kitasatospora sp. NPDC056181]|uniref:hypothetical protein n=1 Tax=Kitasatospora sp. NPDC056181 TaxID=3345737 RepID=UPI0035DAB5DA